MTASADNLAEAALKAMAVLELSARQHKQSSAYHRRQAREMKQSLAELQRVCDALGITLKTQPEEAQSWQKFSQ